MSFSFGVKAIRGAIGSRSIRQVASLYLSQVVFLVGGILTNVLNTRSLDPTSYGRFSFALAVADYVVLFIDFGFYSSGARVLAADEYRQRERRELIGALIAIGALLSLLAGAIVFGLSFLMAPVFKSDTGSALRLFSVLFGLMGLQMLVEAVCRGDNRIGSLAIFRVGAKGLNILLIVAFLLAGTYGFAAALAINLVSNLAAAAVLLFTARPLFSGIGRAARRLMMDVKVYGWNAYLGNIANTASAKTDSMLISAFADPASVGFYNLGNLLTFPMATFSRSLSTTLFKDFAKNDRIPAAVIQVNLLWLSACAVGLIALRKFIVHLLFGHAYDQVIPLILPLALTAVFSGIAQPFNMFMGARGMGSYLRNTAFVMAVVNLSLNVLLIPRYKALGASYATLVALGLNLCLHLYYYRKTLKRISAMGPGRSEGRA